MARAQRRKPQRHRPAGGLSRTLGSLLSTAPSVGARAARPALTSLKSLAALLLSAGLLATPSGSAFASSERYRVELIVFKNNGVAAAPDRATEIRRFRDVFELGGSEPPPVPVLLEKEDGTFANIWSRLGRLADYEPLFRITFEQSMFDFHPPVRIHDDLVMGRERHELELTPAQNDQTVADEASPVDAAVATASDSDDKAPMPTSHEHLLYQLDGSIQLRRSRFLHIDLDLEYRLPGPAWDLAFPTRPEDQLEAGFEWLAGTEPVATPPDTPGQESAEPTPFEFYRLAQSRQIRSNTLQYFDSAYLGAIVRVTPIADEAL